MKSEISSPTCASSPVAAALAEAARQQFASDNFQDELNYRIENAKDTAAFLVTALDNAAFHGFALFPEQLRGVTSLLKNELKVIECLHSALHECLNADLKGREVRP